MKCNILILLTIFILMPLLTQASEIGNYTVQTGSFQVLKLAQNQFDSIVLKLDEKELDHLRIEKIGKYYAVRLGNFKNRVAAEKYLESAEFQISGAIVLKANIHNERIISVYNKSLLSGGTKDAEVTLSTSENDETKVEELLQKADPANNTNAVSMGAAEGSSSSALHSVQPETSITVLDVPELSQNEAQPSAKSFDVKSAELIKKAVARR